MARPLRLEFPGALYHVTSRGNARQNVFQDDADRTRFLSLLRREIHQQGWRCHAYCLMTNHFHLLIETPSGNLVRGMQRLNGAYSQGYNRRHDRVGHLFQGRYQSILVDKDSYLLELSRYIVLNPARAGMVSGVEEWAWSSFPATAGLVEPPDWLEVDWLLNQFGRTRRSAQAAYRRFVQEGLEAKSPLGDLRGQIWLGSDAFRGRMQGLLGDDPLPEIPRDQRTPRRPTKREILRAVCEVFGATEGQVLTRESQKAYQAAAYLLRRGANLSLKDVAGLFGVSPSRITHIQEVVEARGPSRELAQLLDWCEIKI